MEDSIFCSVCGVELTESDMYEFEGDPICEECLDEHTVICSHCEARIWNDDNSGSDSRPLCSRCYDYYYSRCSDCGCLILNEDALYFDDDDDTPFCESFYEKNEDRAYLHDYYYKPEPIFYGDKKRYFGVELEIDCGGKDYNNAKTLSEVANKINNHIYIKTDGSLDEGMEIVTHPMTLDYHINNMMWLQLINTAITLGYLSHKTDTCGLHIHVNRDSFGDTVEKQDECISRVLFFVEKFWTELLKFSRRTEYQINRWAARYGYKHNPKELLDHAKKDNYSRYTSVNITNYHTIEFRIFRGTLKFNTLIATLQLVNEICNVAFSMSDEELQELAWCDFVKGLDNNRELVTYLKERQLYINDPVESEDEQ